MTDTPEAPRPDLSRFRDAVQLRDRCRQAAMAHHERCGLPPSFAYANATYDAIAELVREDQYRKIELPESPLCDCPREQEPPENPTTHAAMDHHCDCATVHAAAVLLGDRDATVHVQQCECRGIKLWSGDHD